MCVSAREQMTKQREKRNKKYNNQVIIVMVDHSDKESFSL
jgi:hypothetical protein